MHFSTSLTLLAFATSSMAAIAHYPPDVADVLRDNGRNDLPPYPMRKDVTDPNNMPGCVRSCLATPFLESGCGIDITKKENRHCLCTNKDLREALEKCVPKKCEDDTVAKIYDEINTDICAAEAGWHNLTTAEREGDQKRLVKRTVLW